MTVSSQPCGPKAIRLTWSDASAAEIRQASKEAFDSGTHRVETHVRVGDTANQRLATFAGLRKEGVARGIAPGADRTEDQAEDQGVDQSGDRIVYALLATDLPADQPEGFRALLNSFLPRKRAIGQMLVRDGAGRVLLCQLTYKKDWDLPGGVVEVGESPKSATGREVAEELALEIASGDLLLTDWLPPWSGWDDAICLVFDGGVLDPARLASVVKEEREIKDVEFATMDQVRQRCADFTVRRIEAAMAVVESGRAGYTESGRKG